MNQKAGLAWELYLKMGASSDSFSLLQVIANDCYKVLLQETPNICPPPAHLCLVHNSRTSSHPWTDQTNQNQPAAYLRSQLNQSVKLVTSAAAPPPVLLCHCFREMIITLRLLLTSVYNEIQSKLTRGTLVFQMGHFYYAAKAFDALEKLDPDSDYWEGKRGACVGVFQLILANKESKCVSVPLSCSTGTHSSVFRGIVLVCSRNGR